MFLLKFYASCIRFFIYPKGIKTKVQQNISNVIDIDTPKVHLISNSLLKILIHIPEIQASIDHKMTMRRPKDKSISNYS